MSHEVEIARNRIKKAFRSRVLYALDEAFGKIFREEGLEDVADKVAESLIQYVESSKENGPIMRGFRLMCSKKETEESG
jgi:hypothetical protein